MLTYYNGEYGTWETAKIPLTDRALFFGDGVYDAAIGRRGRIYLEEEHVERFFGNAELLGLRVGMARRKFSELLNECTARSGYDEFFIYFQLSARADERRHAPRDSGDGNLLITVKSYAPPKEGVLTLISYPDMRQSFCHIKTLNLLGSVMAACAAEDAGADEAVLVRSGEVTECAHSNIFIVEGGALITHPCDERILPGVTRRRLIRLADTLGIEVRERSFSLSELASADDAIVTSTTKLARRAAFLDGQRIAEGDHTVGDALIAILQNDFAKFA